MHVLCIQVAACARSMRQRMLLYTLDRLRERDTVRSQALMRVQAESIHSAGSRHSSECVLRGERAHATASR